MKPSDALRLHREAAHRMIEASGMRNARIFGSVARDADTEESDLDILVEPSAETTLFDIGQLQYELRQLLGVPVQVLTPRALPPGVLQSVLAMARPI